MPYHSDIRNTFLSISYYQSKTTQYGKVRQNDWVQ